MAKISEFKKRDIPTAEEKMSDGRERFFKIIKNRKEDGKEEPHDEMLFAFGRVPGHGIIVRSPSDFADDFYFTGKYKNMQSLISETDSKVMMTLSDMVDAVRYDDRDSFELLKETMGKKEYCEAEKDFYSNFPDIMKQVSDFISAGPFREGQVAADSCGNLYMIKKTGDNSAYAVSVEKGTMRTMKPEDFVCLGKFVSDNTAAYMENRLSASETQFKKMFEKRAEKEAKFELAHIESICKSMIEKAKLPEEKDRESEEEEPDEKTAESRINSVDDILPGYEPNLEKMLRANDEELKNRMEKGITNASNSKETEYSFTENEVNHETGAR